MLWTAKTKSSEGIKRRVESLMMTSRRSLSFWKDGAGDGSGETTGARDRPGCGRKRRERGHYVSRIGARGAGGGCGVGAKHGVEALAVRCDVTDEKSVREMVKEVARELGGIDVLVNNAANYETAEFEKITVAQWDAIFASNTRGPFLVSREALPYLRKRRGRIINMGSLGGLRPWATHAHYCSSKAAVHMLTKVMAKALAPEIAVNAVAPGMIDWERNRRRHS
jgi:NAD(P)-dependent dehydrogenase (short-subunit alcohol dehydrogenase family)